jgi:hypothetical protein
MQIASLRNYTGWQYNIIRCYEFVGIKMIPTRRRALEEDEGENENQNPSKRFKCYTCPNKSKYKCNQCNKYACLKHNELITTCLCSKCADQ